MTVSRQLAPANPSKMPGVEGLRETAEHLTRMAERRGRLHGQIDQGVDVVCGRLQVGSCSSGEAVEILKWVRALGVPGATQRVLDTLSSVHGHAAANLYRWIRLGYNPDEELRLEGTFPVDWQMTPSKGTPCVYLLLAGSQVLYIGYSCSVRERLKSHWRKRTGLDSWRIITSQTPQDAYALEGDLIFQHQPPWNTQGRYSRRVVA